MASHNQPRIHSADLLKAPIRYNLSQSFSIMKLENVILFAPQPNL